jgi:hypothetical protein
VRKEARNLLRHYPTEFDMNMIADREDGMEVVSKNCASPTAYNALAKHFGVEE